MIFDILEQKLIDAGFEPGKTLFRNFQPADASIGVMIRVPLTGVAIDPFIPGWYKTQMQVITRHTDPVEGMKMASRVDKILRVETRETYEPSAERGKAHIDVFFPVTLPIQYPRLEGNAIEFSQHFEAVFGFEST